MCSHRSTPRWTADSANCDAGRYTRVRELPLEVDFIGTPNGFDVESLHCSLSQQTLKSGGWSGTHHRHTGKPDCDGL